MANPLRVQAMPNEQSGFRGVSLKKELVDAIEKYIEKHRDEGYKSVADFVSECVRNRIRELKQIRAAYAEDTH